RVPVWKVERVRRLAERLAALRQVQTVEADRPAQRRLERRRRVDAFVVAPALASEKQDRVRMNLRVLQQEILPADLREQRHLLVGAHFGEVIRILPVQPNQILAHRVGQRRLGQELRPGNPAVAGDDAVLAEMLLVEEHAGTEIQLLKRAAVQELAVALDLDPELFYQPLRGVAVRVRRGNPHGSAQPLQRPTLFQYTLSLYLSH